MFVHLLDIYKLKMTIKFTNISKKLINLGLQLITKFQVNDCIIKKIYVHVGHLYGDITCKL